MATQTVLKEGNCFALFDDRGVGALYWNDTRFVDSITWLLNTKPLALDCTHGDDVTDTSIVLGCSAERDGWTVRVTYSLWQTTLFFRVEMASHKDGLRPVSLCLQISPSFEDLFEVRGTTRLVKGVQASGMVNGNWRWQYRGLDDQYRVVWWKMDSRWNWQTGFGKSQGRAATARTVSEVLDQGERWVGDGFVQLLQASSVNLSMQQVPAWDEILDYRQTQQKLWHQQRTQILSDNRRFQDRLHRGASDLYQLVTDYPEGRVVDAGIPWYGAPFGRDACITSIQSLILSPDVSRDSLEFLARYQATGADPWTDAQPGKILHELRRGEMTTCRETPHSPYYGSVDSTLWWIIALYETWRFTADDEWLKTLLPHLARAVDWLRHDADLDGDHLVEYRCLSAKGLPNQVWKDSEDSVVDDAGRPIDGPIASVEVQGYAFYAYRAAMDMFRALGHAHAANDAEVRSQHLRESFMKKFWDPKGQRMAYVLDGEKHPVWLPTSNMGHLLFTGILPPEVAQWVAERLFEDDLLSGYGIRTLAQGTAPYDPLSYHNGSVWPHDNAIIAWGLRQIGRRDLFNRLYDQLEMASHYFPGGRLPELYGGVSADQTRGAGPHPYPVACDPQAWATVVPFFFLKLALGLEVKGLDVYFVNTQLPPETDRLGLRHLQVAQSEIDVEWTRSGPDAPLQAALLRVQGSARVHFAAGI